MKVKHIEILECVEARTLFRILGRHRAIRELNKGKLSVIPERNESGERDIMNNVFWAQSKNPNLWSALHHTHREGVFNRPVPKHVKRMFRHHVLKGQSS